MTIPSQIRYVYYFAHMLNLKIEEMPSKSGKLSLIRLVTIPKISMTGGCEPHFRLTCGKTVYNTIKEVKPPSLKESIDAIYELRLPDPIDIIDDVFVECFSKGIVGKGSKIFQFWFNVSFVNEDGLLIIHKNMLDKAYRDKGQSKFDKSFRVEIEIRFDFSSESIQGSLDPQTMKKLLDLTKAIPFVYKKLPLF